ncbi:MAG: hypothetical protein E6I80_06710 [Chloroflexi bacterium]|nr:MAG: hypothetical protein E6I80_06710 [Chloroflexota bacterium]
MNSEFSEFTYGFLLCNEIINKQRRKNIISSIPTFPSLLQEAKVGYDVKIPTRGLPLFLQFKLAQYLNYKSRAKCKTAYTQNFFRVTVYRRRVSPQHNLLWELAKKQPQVFYAAPAFHLVTDFKRFFLREDIRSNSVFVPLRRLNEIKDDDEHYVTYVNNKLMSFRWWSEDGIEIEYPIGGRDWLIYIQEQLKDPQNLGLNYLLDLRDTLVNILGKNRLDYELHEGTFPFLQNNDQLSVARDVHYILNVYFGVTLILLPSDD